MPDLALVRTMLPELSGTACTKPVIGPDLTTIQVFGNQRALYQL